MSFAIHRIRCGYGTFDSKVSPMMRPFLFFVVACVPLNLHAEDWPQWRGPAVNNHAAQSATAPVEWDEASNIAWKTEIPGRGNSSPTVVGNRIYLTTGDEKKQTQSLLILDRVSGQLLREVVTHEGGLPDNVTGKNSHANSTVASDGKRVYAMFLNDQAPWLTAYDLSGEQLWQHRIGGDVRVHFEYGFGSSPIICNDLVVVATEFNQDGSGLHAFDPVTGEQRWYAERPKQFSYSTPLPVTLGEKKMLLMCGNSCFAAYDAATGDELWNKEGPTLATCGTMIWDEHLGLAFASGGHPDKFTAAIDLDGGHDVSWQHRAKCYEQSLLTYAGYVYAVTDIGVAYCWRANDGEEMWRKRIGGNFSSSPLLVGGNIYATSETGETHVIEANPEKFVRLAKNQLGDYVAATPAPIGNKLYHRYRQGDHEYLTAIGAKSSTANHLETRNVRVMVVTGGHDYDKVEFATMFQAIPGIDALFVTTEDMETRPSEDIVANFDSIVFLDMVREKVPSRVKDHYVELSEAGVGMVFLHFTLASRPYWDGYHDMVGGKFYLPGVEKNADLHSTYKTDLTVQARVLNKTHPLTLGLEDFVITDAFYGNITIAPDAQPLLAASDERTSNCLAWTHEYGKSRVVYLMPGFTKQAYENPSYRQLIANSVRYVAP